MEYVIEAENLRKKFGDLVAVDGISFSVALGECFGMLGPNGAGKTSTIRMIYGFSPMTGGHLKVFGLDIPRDLRDIKSRIGVCQQENTLDPDLTVQQNLEVFARYFDIPKKAAREKARELLQFIALDHRKNARVNELSGGLTRRLVLARALIHYPQGLLMVPLAFLGGIAFGSIGMFFTAIVSSIEMFNLPIFLFVTPMFLFSGTFFPVENLPSWAQELAMLLPLTHLVKLTRSFSFGLVGTELLWNVAYLLIFSLISFPLALLKMRQRLIK